MGDALRNAIAISGYWTNAEKKLCSEIALEKLGPVYAVENIPKDRPADRARYWDEKLKIEDNGEEEKRILKISKEINKAKALRALEKIAVERFF